MHLRASSRRTGEVDTRSVVVSLQGDGLVLNEKSEWFRRRARGTGCTILGRAYGEALSHA